MAKTDIPRWKWNKQDLLVQEIDVQGKLREIKLRDALKTEIHQKWYEPTLKMLVIIAAVAFAMSFLLFLDKGLTLQVQLTGEGEGLNARGARWVFVFIAASFSVMLIGGLVIVSLLMERLDALRRLVDIQMRAMEEMKVDSDDE